MIYQTIVYFKLKCPVRGCKDKRPASECRGEDAPTCKNCYGIPMMLEEVTTERVWVG